MGNCSKSISPFPLLGYGKTAIGEQSPVGVPTFYVRDLNILFLSVCKVCMAYIHRDDGSLGSDIACLDGL